MTRSAGLLSRLTFAERLLFGVLAHLGRWLSRLPIVGRILLGAMIVTGLLFVAWLVLLLAT